MLPTFLWVVVVDDELFMSFLFCSRYIKKEEN